MWRRSGWRALRDDEGPGVVQLGKGGLSLGQDRGLDRKYEIMRRHLSVVLVTKGPVGLHTRHGVPVIGFPSFWPPFLAGMLLRTLGPPIAVALAAKEGRAIVCQSPFEGFGAILWRSLVPARRRPPVVVEVHGDWRSAARLYGSRFRRLVAPVSDRVAVWALRRSDRVRVIGAYTEQLVRQAGYTGGLDRFVTYTDFSLFLGSPVRPFPERPRVAFVGSFEPYKAVDVLVDAWPWVLERVPEAFLELAGTGPMSDAIRRRARDLGVERSMSFLGDVSRGEVRELLDRSSLLVLPSRSEGLGRVVLEAFARGRPVVGSAVGGIPELVHDGKTGRLVPPGDVRVLAGALVEVLNDREGLIDMGATAREVAEERDLVRDFEEGMIRLREWIESRV